MDGIDVISFPSYAKPIINTYRVTFSKSICLNKIMEISYISAYRQEANEAAVGKYKLFIMKIFHLKWRIKSV